MDQIRKGKNGPYSDSTLRFNATHVQAGKAAGPAIVGSNPLSPSFEQPQYSAGSRWFAVRVKPNHEKSVAAILHEKNFKEFLPLFRSRRRWSDRVKVVDLPLFPGYLFCHLNLSEDNRLPLLTTPGLLYIVGSGKNPEPIDDSEIQAIQAISHSGLVYAPWPSLVVGQRVRLESGPLCGLEGVLTRIGSQYKIHVSVTLLQRSVSVEVDTDSIRVIDREHAITPA